MQAYNYNSEADVETKYVYDILLKKILEISEKQVCFHVPVKFYQGHQVQTKEADVLVKNEQGKNFIVIDSKAPNQNLEAFFGQIDSYAFNLETPISILTNAHRLIVRIYQEGNKKTVLLDKTIKELEFENYESLLSIFSNSQLAKEKEIKNQKNDDNKIKINKPKIINYRKTFRNIHTKIRSIDKLDPSASFDEFSKVLFIKIINDRLQEEEQLTVKKIENYKVTKYQQSFVNQWFREQVKSYYPGIFAESEKVNLSPKALIEVLEILDTSFDLKDSLTDVKGRAFEEFLPSQLRGKGLGQFFTPRTVVDFMVDLADISFKDKVLDFASGSGGFLIKAFSEKKRLISNLPSVFLDALKKTESELEEEAKSQIFGIDAEPRAVRTAKMNMLLWGDGKQIQHGNGLAVKDADGKDYLAQEYDKNVPSSGVDVILANPPFGSTEEDQEILSKYSLSSLKKDSTGNHKYTKEKTENLFVERAWKLLKPDGKLLIVLPEGIFSNATSKTRDFILSHFRIETIVRLPKHTFVMSGVDTINTVILVAYKNNEVRQNEILISDKNTWISDTNPMTINFASVNQIGFEPSGKILLNGFESSDFNILFNKLKKFDFDDIITDPMEFSELEYGEDEKSQSWKKSMVKFTRKEFTSVPKRIDPTFFFFHKEFEEILNTFISIPISKNEISKDKISIEELENNLEEIYTYVSVVKNIDGIITQTEDKTVDEIVAISSGSQRLKYNDIVFNPYRINTGSIIRINSKEKNLITSPAYVVISTSKINSEYLVQLLKTPFMKYQIEVLASGSVRDNFGAKDLLDLKIPNIPLAEQDNMMDLINQKLNSISETKLKIIEENKDITNILNNF